MSPSNFFQINSALGSIFIIGSPKGISRLIFGRDGFNQFVRDLNGANITEGGDAEKSGRERFSYILRAN